MDKICYAPWSNVEILPSGDILPCCKFVDRYYDEKFNITTHDISDHYNSQKLITIKQQMLDGEWPQGCERCRIEEQANIPSRRQLDYQRWQHYYQNYDLNSNELLTMGIAIGNVCNLKCIICNPYASSRWQKEYQDIYGRAIPSIEKFRKNFIKSLTDRSPGLVHLDIHGGEPFLSGITEHQQLLDHYINTGQAKNISIHYTTNGTIWPEHWFQRWQHFREIDLQISIDGVGSRFEYLRYPAVWETLVDNVVRYLDHERNTENFRISVAHTVSAFNVYYVDEFVDWCLTMGLPMPWMGNLHNPSFLRPTVWHSTAKQCIINNLNNSQIPEVRAWSKLVDQNDNSDEFTDFRQYIQQHDGYRRLRYQHTFPEMSKFL